MKRRLPFVWDYDLDEDQFTRILAGDLTLGNLNQRWAVLRLLEYAPYSEIIRLLSFKEIVDWWPDIRSRVRSKSRTRGFDFLVRWLQDNHPEVLRG